ncbi:hypothetical protein EJ05DRAFT_471941 [Pseudovirgaria hyperparasitica]|uniref:Chromo domain-containing protein n=1 Tax=Pseudovirgaria hyperparasitica TaxID=470096 RepID=A0A6A6WLG2_9PEZI|nr:uncharacterized protein EJ05DRAFT_471941 [Pseudovirgaria hyperparasitica]KAF2762986.1 hypothetical protein EJ05DRAFT_471941 [Pseudovirgaria hyperparasitica]
MTSLYNSVVHAITPGRTSKSREPSLPATNMPNFAELSSELASEVADIAAPVSNMLAAPFRPSSVSSGTVPTDPAPLETRSSAEPLPKTVPETALPAPMVEPDGDAPPKPPPKTAIQRGRAPTAKASAPLTRPSGVTKSRGPGRPKGSKVSKIQKPVAVAQRTSHRNVKAPERFEPIAFKPPVPKKHSGFYEIKAIIEENDDGYKVDWAGKDPKTKKPYEPTWIPKDDANVGAIKEWEKKQKKVAKDAKAAGPKTTGAKSRGRPTSSNAKRGGRPVGTATKKAGRPAGIATKKADTTIPIAKKRGRPAAAKKPVAAKTVTKEATKTQANMKARMAKSREGRASKRAGLKSARR